MIYKLERRGTGLAIPVSLFNFLIQNGIKYTYDFREGGIEVSEEAYKMLSDTLGGDSRPVSDKIDINHSEEPGKPLKIENMKSKEKRRKKLW